MNEKLPTTAALAPTTPGTLAAAGGEAGKAAGSNSDLEYQDLLQAAQRLIERVHRREEEVRRLLRVTQNINRGLGLDEILEFIYQELKEIVPFNRIACALVEETTGRVVARWARTDRLVYLSSGYAEPLAGSTLQTIIQTGRSRILNDLPAYLASKPQSRSTALVVREGMRSSLTCPLVVQGRPIGFLFFDSVEPNSYADVHVEFFQEIAEQLAVILEKGRLYSELAEQAAIIERQNQQMTKKLELARALQRSFIPERLPPLPGLEVAFVYEPAIQVGGDLLDILRPESDDVLVFIGDAMGHGVEAAMLMAAARTALHTAAHTTSDPAAVLQQINRNLADLIGDRFVTAACARLQPTLGVAEVAVAGNVLQLCYDAGTAAVSRPGDSGLPLGIKAAETYRSVRCAFQPGDCLVLCTDGLVEASNARAEAYGEERLIELVRRHGTAGARGLLREIEASLKIHCRNAPPQDDVTVLVVQAAAPC